MRPNKLRELLKADKPSICVRVNTVWPDVIEWVGQMGFYDYVEFAAEYGPYDLHDFDNLARAAELVGISSMIKIDQEPRTYIAERALAAGIQNVLFADIRTVEDAEEAVRAVRAEPKGVSGYRMDRRVGYVGCTASKADVVKMCKDAVVALMIEKKSAVENLEEILSIEGVDMVQFGPSDYSLSIGLLGETNHPKVREFLGDELAKRLGYTGDPSVYEGNGVLLAMENDFVAALNSVNTCLLLSMEGLMKMT